MQMQYAVENPIHVEIEWAIQHFANVSRRMRDILQGW